MDSRQRKNLENLADFLDKLPRKNFDMHSFYGRDRAAHKNSCKYTAPTAIKCGTACCVAGWAAIRHRKSWPKHDCGILDMSESIFADFFGITPSHSNQICMSGFNRTPKQKAKEIREIIQEESSKG